MALTNRWLISVPDRDPKRKRMILFSLKSKSVVIDVNTLRHGMCPVSLSDKTSYRKISRTLEVARLVVQSITVKSDRHIGGTAVEVPVKFQSNQTISKTKFATSILCEILEQYVLSDIETGPWLHEYASVSWFIIVSGNDWPPVRHAFITWFNAGLLSIAPQGKTVKLESK